MKNGLKRLTAGAGRFYGLGRAAVVDMVEKRMTRTRVFIGERVFTVFCGICGKNAVYCKMRIDGLNPRCYYNGVNGLNPHRTPPRRER